MLKNDGFKRSENYHMRQQKKIKETIPDPLSSGRSVPLRPDWVGFVEKAEEWTHSSAGDYYRTRKGRVELVMIE